MVRSCAHGGIGYRRRRRRTGCSSCVVAANPRRPAPASQGELSMFPDQRTLAMRRTEPRHELLYGEELFDRIRERPLAWLPLGILEHHGEHLPWGLDGLKAHAVCLRLAARLGGVVLPPNHFAGIHGSEEETA